LRSTGIRRDAGQPAAAGNSDNDAMKKTTIATTRKGNTPIKVYCLPEEKQQIEANAAATGLSTSAYLLKVGQGYRVRGILDHQRVEELARINGDLGRLGGLLKLWLAGDARAADFDAATLRAVLAKIERTQDNMLEVMQTVVMSKGRRDVD